MQNPKNPSAFRKQYLKVSRERSGLVHTTYDFHAPAITGWSATRCDRVPNNHATRANPDALHGNETSNKPLPGTDSNFSTHCNEICSVLLLCAFVVVLYELNYPTHNAIMRTVQLLVGKCTPFYTSVGHQGRSVPLKIACHQRFQFY